MFEREYFDVKTTHDSFDHILYIQYGVFSVNEQKKTDTLMRSFSCAAPLECYRVVVARSPGSLNPTLPSLPPTFRIFESHPKDILILLPPPPT